jgi:antitoxin FitA
MATLTVRQLPDAIHRALKLRAKRHGRSTEAEVRAILTESVTNRKGKGMGDELAALGEAFGGIELELERSPAPMRSADFD